MSFGIGSPPAGPPPGNADGHPQAANQLVLQGFLYPGSDDLVSKAARAGSRRGIVRRPPLFRQGDDFSFDPLGECEDALPPNGVDFCNPAIVPGNPNFEFQCGNALRGVVNNKLPGSGAPNEP